MRIVGGAFRGRAIQAPSGDATRPTVDRVREALFSTIYSLTGGLDGCTALDAFAGSGALGLEALSRGAACTVFCESDRKALAAIKKNIAVCGVASDEAVVLTGDAFKQTGAFLARGMRFDLVLLDPPYAYSADDVVGFMAALEEAGLLAEDALCVYEHALSEKAHVEEACTRAGFTIRASKKYGKTGVTIVQCGSSPE